MSELAARLSARLAAAGLELENHVADGVLTYLDLLATWNPRINLTAFDLSAPTDEALERLVVEPILAASLVSATARYAVDIGSGGGSPAVPLTLAAPWVDMTMVEVRVKKAAFLREVARTLPMVRLKVEAMRAEELARRSPGRFDVVTMRAVRADRAIWQAVVDLLVAGGQVLWFGGAGQELRNSGLVEAGPSGIVRCLVKV